MDGEREVAIADSVVAGGLLQQAVGVSALHRKPGFRILLTFFQAQGLTLGQQLPRRMGRPSFSPITLMRAVGRELGLEVGGGPPYWQLGAAGSTALRGQPKAPAGLHPRLTTPSCRHTHNLCHQIPTSGIQTARINCPLPCNRRRNRSRLQVEGGRLTCAMRYCAHSVPSCST